jgi:Sigma-70 factor, region 1.1
VTIAVCVRCGAQKFGSFTACKTCHHTPASEHELIYSLAFSDHCLDASQLVKVGQEIREGIVLRIPKEQEDILRPAAKEYLEKFGSVIRLSQLQAGRGGPGVAAPLLDLTDAAVVRFISTSKRRGYVTLDQLNEMLPTWEVSADEIEATMEMLSRMGIRVIESEEHAERMKTAQQAEEPIGRSPAGGQARQINQVKSEPGNEMMTAASSERKLGVGQRAKAGLVWFLVGGFAIGLVTVIPAIIVGFHNRYGQFVYLCGLIFGIAGFVYGRIPKILRPFV